MKSAPYNFKYQENLYNFSFSSTSGNSDVSHALPQLLAHGAQSSYPAPPNLARLLALKQRVKPVAAASAASSCLFCSNLMNIATSTECRISQKGKPSKALCFSSNPGRSDGTRALLLRLACGVPQILSPPLALKPRVEPVALPL